jgi:hypothetical protein
VTTEATKERQRRRHMPSMARAIRQALKAGLNIASASASLDGWSLTFANGEEVQASSSNPWDEVLQRDAH